VKNVICGQTFRDYDDDDYDDDNNDNEVITVNMWLRYHRTLTKKKYRLLFPGGRKL
jgi:hypothetical protein